MLTGWLPILSERAGEPLDTLAALDTPTLCRRIAQAQYGIALDTARAARLLTGKEHAAKLRELAGSTNELDRIAADLVRQWDAADQARKFRR